MTTPENTLKKLGLTDKEARVYLALLKLGQASANSIARSANLKRPTTYLILEDLRQQGMVLKMPGSKKQMFSARSPEELLYEIKKNLSEAEHLLPELMNTYNANTSQVRTIHFEGVSGIREAFWYKIDSLKGKEVVAFYGGAEDASQELINISHNWNEELAKQGTHIRSLVPDDQSLKQFREKDKIYEFLPKILPQSVYTSKVSIDINDNFVRIVMFKEQQATIIENPKVAKALKEIFEIVWQSFPKKEIALDAPKSEPQE